MQRVGFTLLPGFQVMSFAVISVFEFANREIGEQIYDVHLLSETGGPIRSSIAVARSCWTPRTRSSDRFRAACEQAR